MANLSLIVPVLLLALFIKEGEPVRCWVCSSDLSPQCNDPFNPGNVEHSYMYSLKDCDASSGVIYPYLQSTKTACKKQIKQINGQTVITRGCTWKRSDDDTSTCPVSSDGRNIITTYCKTCEYDGCNGASTVGKTIALLVAPLSLLLFK